MLRCARSASYSYEDSVQGPHPTARDQGKGYLLHDASVNSTIWNRNRSLSGATVMRCSQSPIHDPHSGQDHRRSPLWEILRSFSSGGGVAKYEESYHSIPYGVLEPTATLTKPIHADWVHDE